MSSAVVSRYANPPITHPFRVIAQKILTGEVVDWDVPVGDDFEYTRIMSGPTTMRGSFKPEIVSIQELLLDPYSFYFHVEIDNEIRATGILLPPEYNDAVMTFDCEGFSALPHYHLYEVEYSGIQVDPSDVIRSIWTHVQSKPESNLGIVVATTTTPVRIGEAARAATSLISDRNRAAMDIRFRVQFGLYVFEDWTWTYCPGFVSDNNDSLLAQYASSDVFNVTAVVNFLTSVVTNEGVPQKLQAAYDIRLRFQNGMAINSDWTWAGCPDYVNLYNDELVAGYDSTDVLNAHEVVVYLTKLLEPEAQPVAAKPYELMWWDATNCGDEIDKLCTESSIDYMERVQWNSTKTNVEKYIDFYYPRVGTRKDTLRFADGENILATIPVQETPNNYASNVYVIGAGEGRDAIRGYAGGTFGDRVRKAAVVTDKSITTVERANSIASEELLRRRTAAFEINTVILDAYHENAPFGTYDVGDDIWIDVDVPWLSGIYGEYYRIVSITYHPSTDRVDLEVKLASTFSYGGRT
jgi:hypothetical protein